MSITNEKIIAFFRGQYSQSELIYDYCIDKGMDKTESQVFILSATRRGLLPQLIQYIMDDFRKDKVLVFNKTNVLIYIYNGK